MVLVSNKASDLSLSDTGGALNASSSVPSTSAPFYFVDDEWVCIAHETNFQRLCWLPEPSRGHIIAYYEDKIAIGAESGCVTILDLSATQTHHV